MILSDLNSADEMVRWIAPLLVPGESQQNGRTVCKGEQYTVASTDESPEELVRKASAECYEQGVLKGYADCSENVNAEREQLLRLLRGLARPLSQFDSDLMQELLLFGVAIARLMLKRELQIDSSIYLELIKSACTEYALDAQAVTVKMHPEDVGLVQACQPAEDDHSVYRLVACPDLERGSCLLDTGNYFVDISADNFVNRIAENLVDKQKPDVGQA